VNSLQGRATKKGVFQEQKFHERKASIFRITISPPQRGGHFFIVIVALKDDLMHKPIKI